MSDAATLEPAATVPPAAFRRLGVPRLMPVLLFLLVFAQAAAVAVGLRAISEYDEAAHFDYVVQLRQGEFPVPAGQRYSDQALQQWACRPVDKAASVAPLCGRLPDADRSVVPFADVNYEAPIGPVYYLIAAAGSAVMSPFGGSAFVWARLVSACLYAGGAALLLAVAVRFARSRWAAFGAVLAASSTALALSTGGTVSPDALVYAETAAVLAAAVLVVRRRPAVAWTVGVAVLAGLTKPNFVVIALLGSSLLLLRWVVPARPRTRSAWLRAAAEVAAPPVACGVAAAGWSALAGAINSTGLPADGGLHTVIQSPLGPLARTWKQLVALLRPDTGAAFTALTSPGMRITGVIVVLLLLGGCFLAWFRRPGVDTGAVLVLRATAIAAPVAAVVLVATMWVSLQHGFLAQQRYGLPLLAAGAVGVGGSLHRRYAMPVLVLAAVTWVAAWTGLA
jgi:hypothetical protein